MESTSEKADRTSKRTRHGLARFLAIAVIVVVMLAGCIMPDGTVYTLPSMMESTSMADSTTVEQATAEDDAQNVDQSATDGASPAEPYLLAGDEALAANDLETALAEFTRAIEADRDASYGWYRLALVLGYYGELEAALDDANRAIALSPNDPYYYELRGQIRSAMGELDGAVADYSAALDGYGAQAGIDPLDSISAYYSRAQARIALGDITAARDDIGEILRIDPLLTDLYADYRQLAASADLVAEKMAEYNRFAHESDSAGATAYADGMKQLMIAQFAQAPEAYAAAVELLSEAIDADPALADAYRARGVARIGTAALPELMGTVSVGPDDATYTDPDTGEEVTVTREEWDADWGLQQQIADEAREMAIADLTTAVELDPTNVEAIYDLGVAHFARQEALYGSVFSMPDPAGREQALELLDRAMEMEPDWDQARLSRAIASQYWAAQIGGSVLNWQSAPVAELAYMDDDTIVVLRTDMTVDLWNPTESRLQTIRSEPMAGIDEFSSMRLSPDLASFVTTNYGELVHGWDTESGELLLELDGEGAISSDAAMSADGTRVAAAGYYGARVWDAETGEVLAEIPGSWPIDLSPDGSLVVVNTPKPNPDLAVVDAATGITVTVLTGPVDSDTDEGDAREYIAETVRFSPDGQTVAALSNRGVLRVWNLTTDEDVRVFSEDSGYFGDARIVFSQDGTRLATTRGDGRILVYDLETGEEVLVAGDFDSRGSGQTALAFSPNGTRLVSAGADGTLYVRDAQTGELITSAVRERTEEILALEQSTRELLERTLDDANLLIEREAGDGWPYFVRGSVIYNLAELDGAELDEDAQNMVDQDWQAFLRLSPNVRPDDVVSYMPAQVRFSGANAPYDPLMAGRIEYEDEGRTFVHEAGGFRLQIPDQGPTGRVGDVYVPGDPAFVGVVDDFRRFFLIAMEGELGELSAEEWVASRALSPEETEAGGLIHTEYGEASVVRLLDSDITAAVLPIDGRIFYFAYIPQTWMGDERHVFASGYGLKLGPEQEVLAEFVKGLSLLEE